MGQQWVLRVAACLLVASGVGLPTPTVAQDSSPQLSSPANDRRMAAEVSEADAAGAKKAGEELYRRGEYALAAERFGTALAQNPQDPESLMFEGLVDLRQNEPGKAAAAWGRLQDVTSDERLRQDLGRMRTILLREQSERAAREAVAAEQRLREMEAAQADAS